MRSSQIGIGERHCILLILLLLNALVADATPLVPRQLSAFVSLKSRRLVKKRKRNGLLSESYYSGMENCSGKLHSSNLQIASDARQEGRGPSSYSKVCVMDDILSSDFFDVVHSLVEKTSLPLYSESVRASERCSHCLRVIPHKETSSYAIAIEQLPPKDLSKRRMTRGGDHRQFPKSVRKPFFIDFCPPMGSKLDKRIKGQMGKDLLIKSVGPARAPGRSGAIVYDLTAGFGQDSVVIARGGAAKVHMVERDPVIGTLLEDSLRRLRLVAESEEKDDARVKTAIELSQKLSFALADGIDVAKSINSYNCTLSDTSSQRPDVCYLDPMFPPRSKSAQVKKNMQLLHELLDSQDTSENAQSEARHTQLLEAAYEAARFRVVVKRPVNAKPIGGRLKKSYDIRGSINRWDIYVKA